MGGDGEDSLRRQLEALTAIVADQARALAGLSVVAPTSSATLRQVFEAYEDHRRGGHSWINIRNRILPLVRLRGDMPADQLTPREWADHRRARLKEPVRKGKPPAPKTLNLELARAKTMLTWAAAAEQGLIKVNPLREARREKDPPPRRTWLAEGDLQALLACAPATVRARVMFTAFALTGADTGLRFNEIRTLRRELVADCIARIPVTKNGKSHVVALTARADAALRAVPRCLGSPYFFANPDTGSLMARTTIWRWFRTSAERAGLDSIVAPGEVRVRPHDLRRSAATNAHNRGASLLEVQDMLNHSNPSITSQYVLRTEANAIRIAALMQDGAERERVGPRRSPVNALINRKATSDPK